jgi:hypothetical protein
MDSTGSRLRTSVSPCEHGNGKSVFIAAQELTEQLYCDLWVLFHWSLLVVVVVVAFYKFMNFKALLLFHNDAHNHTSLLCCHPHVMKDEDIES